MSTAHTELGLTARYVLFVPGGGLAVVKARGGREVFCFVALCSAADLLSLERCLLEGWRKEASVVPHAVAGVAAVPAHSHQGAAQSVP